MQRRRIGANSSRELAAGRRLHTASWIPRPKSEPRRRVPSNLSGSGMRLGLGTGSTAQALCRAAGRAGARRTGNHRCADFGGYARTGASGLALRSPRSTRPPNSTSPSMAPTRSRPDLTLIKGRRRSAVARENRGLGVGEHDRHCRRIEMGRRPWPLSAADRNCAVWRRRHPPRGRGGGRRGRLPRGRPPLRQGAGRPCFRHGWRALASGRPVAAYRRPSGLRRDCRPFPGVMEHGLFIGLAGTAILAGPDGVRLVERP